MKVHEIKNGNKKKKKKKRISSIKLGYVYCVLNNYSVYVIFVIADKVMCMNDVFAWQHEKVES